MHCANHPDVETELACGRCNRPICTRCLTHTEVGIRCQECCVKPQKHRLRLGVVLGVGSIVLFVSVVAAPHVLGLKPDVSSSGLSDTSDFSDISFFDATVVVPTSPPLAPDAAYDVLVASATCTIESEYSWAGCTGSVKNLLPEKLREVEVVVALLSDDGTVQASSSGPIDYDPLLPGQESPWGIQAPLNPEFSKYSVAFRTAFGQPLRAQVETP